VVLSGGTTLTVTGSLRVHGLKLNGVAFSLVDTVATADTLDNVQFTGYATSATQLTVQGPGGAAAPRSLTFNNLVFQPLLATDTGLYIKLTSSNGFGYNLNLAGSNEGTTAGGNGPTKSNPPNQQSSGGATILWP
jgi:hypothetical protein